MKSCWSVFVLQLQQGFFFPVDFLQGLYRDSPRTRTKKNTPPQARKKRKQIINWSRSPHHSRHLDSLLVRQNGHDHKTPKLLLQKIHVIQATTAASTITFDIDVQHPRGSFGLDFLSQFHGIYSNCRVKYKPKRSYCAIIKCTATDVWKSLKQR